MIWKGRGSRVTSCHSAVPSTLYCTVHVCDVDVQSPASRSRRRSRASRAARTRRRAAPAALCPDTTVCPSLQCRSTPGHMFYTCARSAGAELGRAGGRAERVGQHCGEDADAAVLHFRSLGERQALPRALLQQIPCARLARIDCSVV